MRPHDDVRADLQRELGYHAPKIGRDSGLADRWHKHWRVLRIHDEQMTASSIDNVYFLRCFWLAHFCIRGFYSAAGPLLSLQYNSCVRACVRVLAGFNLDVVLCIDFAMKVQVPLACPFLSLLLILIFRYVFRGPCPMRYWDTGQSILRQIW
jgi:hypothetical protein